MLRRKRRRKSVAKKFRSEFDNLDCRSRSIDTLPLFQAMQFERDQAAEDLRNVESAFADVHRKYERTKEILEEFKRNEEELKKTVQECQMKLMKQASQFK